MEFKEDLSMTEKEVKPPFDGEVTFVCPKCHRPVTWEDCMFSDGSVIQAPNWTCKYCSTEVLEFYADLYQIHKQ